MPYAVEHELTPMGRELLDVSGGWKVWLSQAPDGPISLESGAAKGAVKALIDGWGSTMMRALAARPLSLTELDSLISDLSYPALERRLSSMRIAGLVEAQPSKGAGTPYGGDRLGSPWASRRWPPPATVSSSTCGPPRAPVTEIDIEAALLLATPLVALERASGGYTAAQGGAQPGVYPGPVRDPGDDRGQAR